MGLPDRLDPSLLIRAYCTGIFPMADRDGAIHWYAPNPRAVLEHEHLRVSRSLRSMLRKRPYEIRVNNAFRQVMLACAAPREGDPDTWISDEFVHCYGRLHGAGFAHSVEAWSEGELVGGLYGVSVGGAFMGESMFSRSSGASKLCLVALVERLRARGFVLHDVQFLTAHLAALGATEIPRAEYERRLQRAVLLPCTFEGPLTGAGPR